jgi:hypothetical protein
MMDFLKPVLLAATILSASVAHAGGPVIIEEGNGDQLADKPGSSIGILPVLGALVLVCLLACGGGGGEDDPVVVDEDKK